MWVNRKRKRSAKGSWNEVPKNARGTGYRQTDIDDVIPRREESLRSTTHSFDFRDRDLSSGLQGVLPQVQRSSAALFQRRVSLARVAESSLSATIGDRLRAPIGLRTAGLLSRTSENPPSEKKKKECAYIAPAIFSRRAVRAPDTAKSSSKEERVNPPLDQCAFRQCGWMYDDDDDDVRTLVIGVAMIVPRWSRHVERS